MSTPSSALYPVTSPVNGINQGLFPYEVNKAFFKEWVQITPLWNFMGNEITRPIVRHKMKAGEGWQYSVGKLNALDYTKPILNFDQVSGQGQYQSIDCDNIICQGISFPVTIKGRELLSLGTPIDLPSSVRPQLIEASQRYLNKQLFDSAMSGTYPVAAPGAAAVVGKIPSYDRIVRAGFPESPTNRTNYNGVTGGLQTAANNLTALSTSGVSKMSSEHLNNLKRYAVQGGSLIGPANDVTAGGQTTEDPIRPAYLKSRGGFPMNDYILLTPTQCVQQLMQDSTFFQSTAARGTVIDASDQPQAIYGSEYIGKFYGIHIYEVKDMQNYIFTSQDGTKLVAWSILIGAGAWSLGWFEEPTIAFRDNQIDRIQEYTTHEIRGQKALSFQAKRSSTATNGNTSLNKFIEQGIVHSLTVIG